MGILALDLATKTGWAHMPSAGMIQSGVWDFRPKRFEGGGMRYVRFQALLRELHRAEPIKTIYFEEVRRHIGTDAAHIYGGLLAHLSAWCDQEEVPYSGVPVGTIKKWATGKGNANKAAMVEAMVARGFLPDDDNEADALAILLCSLPADLSKALVERQRNSRKMVAA